MIRKGGREKQREESGNRLEMEAGSVQGGMSQLLQQKEIRQSGFSALVSDILDQIISFSAGLSCAPNDVTLCSWPLPIEC